MLRHSCLLALFVCLVGSATVGAVYANGNAHPKPTLSNRPLLVPLPPVTPVPSIVRVTVAGTPNPPPQGIDGTWRQEGSFLIIDLNGQQLRLANTGLQATTDTIPTRVEDNTGEIYGQLSHRGWPLVDCEVVLIPLRKTWVGYRTANREEHELFTTTTEATGVYHFASVPAGRYKLKWRPAGEASWIRRAEIRPDVYVRANKTATIKEIRVALRTIN